MVPRLHNVNTKGVRQLHAVAFCPWGVNPRHPLHRKAGLASRFGPDALEYNFILPGSEPFTGP